MLSRAGATSACVILVLQIARQEEVSMHDFEPCQLVPPCGVKDFLHHVSDQATPICILSAPVDPGRIQFAFADGDFILRRASAAVRTLIIERVSSCTFSPSRSYSVCQRERVS